MSHMLWGSQDTQSLIRELSRWMVGENINLTFTEHAEEPFNYTPGIYAEGYIVFVFPFVRSYVRMFVRSFVRSYFLPSRGICVKVLR